MQFIKDVWDTINPENWSVFKSRSYIEDHINSDNNSEYFRSDV